MSKKLKFLSPEQKKFWTENGFVKLSNVLSNKEVQEFSDAYNELFERKQRENVSALEAAWAGEDMKKAANGINYTVSHLKSFTRQIEKNFEKKGS